MKHTPKKAQPTPSEVAAMREKFRWMLGYVRRKGMPKLIDWLDSTDFYSAPSSSRFYNVYAGGLVQHSLDVCDNYKRLVATFPEKTKDISEESVIIEGLLHDVCKANFYNMKYISRLDQDTGQYYDQPYVKVEDQFPLGHGEKSVYLIERFIRLTVDEALAIRWHMGAFDEGYKGQGGANRTLQLALDNPHVFFLNAAEQISSFADGVPFNR